MNNKDDNVRCSPEPPNQRFHLFWLKYIAKLYVATNAFLINSVTQPQFLAQGTRILSALLLLNHCCCQYAAFGSSLWLDSRFAAKELCFFQKAASPCLLAYMKDLRIFWCQNSISLKGILFSSSLEACCKAWICLQCSPGQNAFHFGSCVLYLWYDTIAFSTPFDASSAPSEKSDDNWLILEGHWIRNWWHLLTLTTLNFTKLWNLDHQTGFTLQLPGLGPMMSHVGHCTF